MRKIKFINSNTGKVLASMDIKEDERITTTVPEGATHVCYHLKSYPLTPKKKKKC